MYLLNSVSAAVICIGFAAVAGPQTALEQQLTDAVKNSVSPEERALIEQEHQNFRNHHGETRFQRTARYTACDNRPAAFKKAASQGSFTAVKRVLILVNSTLYANDTAKSKIGRYCTDIGNTNSCKVELEAISGGTIDTVKNIIKKYYNDQTNGSLDGVIQIGSLPVPWYEGLHDFDASGEYNSFTCDLYYMDLDGTWLDTMTHSKGSVVKKANGIFDGHTKGSGDLGPEVFYARIDPATMGKYGKEVKLLGDYLDKDHNFYTGKITVADTAVYTITAPWHGSSNYVSKVYGAEHTVKYDYSSSTPSATVCSTYQNTLKYQYSVLHLWCHANYNLHAFSDNKTSTELPMEKVYSAIPKPIAYFQDGCYLADFTQGGNKAFLAGCYVFNTSPTALVCFSGTKSGQWIGLVGKELFTQLGYNTCLGEAFKIWMKKYENSNEPSDQLYFTSWNYGYVIIGDPMLTFVNQKIVPVAQKDAQAMQPGQQLACAFNTMNRKLTVSYTLPRDAATSIELYTMQGNRIRTLASGPLQKGGHSAAYNVRGLAEGMYIVSLRSGSLCARTRISIIKQ